MSEQEFTNRISPEMVVEAYRVTGLKPCRWLVDCGDECCGVGVVQARDGIPGDERHQKCCEKYGVPYTHGFQDGFDGQPTLPQFSSNRERYIQGHADGVAAAAVVFNGKGGE